MRQKYNFQEMSIGDVKYYDDVDQCLLSSASANHSRYNKNGRKYKTKQEQGGATICRTK